ncbi:MAG TPA: hypothetical protein VFC19_37245 [Candidatus Limnocylindrales bacterium]|nr:hypothetical protein [Candidatus Limnocylindrales bacterium]
MKRCGECGEWEPAGAPVCSRCAALIDEIVESGWRSFLDREFGAVSAVEERAIGEMVAQEPERHEWRVYDAALDRIVCHECGSRLGRGPANCHPCQLADGNRYASIEIDRPGVPPGNEHAIRVNVAVLRRAHILSPAELMGRRLLLPMLIAGELPTTAEAQRAAKLLKLAVRADGRE